MKVTLKNCSMFYVMRLPNFLDHFVYSSPPDQMITSSPIYHSQLMSDGGQSISTERPTNWTSAYIVETDCVTLRTRGIWVPIGLVCNYRTSFKPRRKVCSFGCLLSASISQVRKPSIPMASSDHYYPIAICPVALRRQRWTSSTLKS